jgi:AcrR family transcriptional regulator
MGSESKRPSARSAGGRRKKSAPNQTERLMLVGLDLFSKKDFSAVTIKNIARAARVNSALIYYYFQNKEDLFKASIEYAILQALENYTRLKEKHSNPVDLINDWFENNIEMSTSFRKLIKIMLDYSNSLARLTSVDRLIKHFYKEEMSILSSSVREGVALGLFEPVDPEQAAQFASVHLDGIMVASMIRSDFDLEAAVANLRDLFWHRLGYRGQGGLGNAREAVVAYKR